MTTRLPVADSSAWTGVAVSEAMHPGVVTCPRDATLPTIAEIMTTHCVHAVVVAPLQGGAPLVVTDRALVGAMVQGAADVTAADVAREPIATLSTEATLGDAAQVMAVSYATHVLAIDPSSGVPVGVVSSLDVVAAVGGISSGLARLLPPVQLRPAPAVRSLNEARVSDVMHPGVITSTPDAPLHTVARIMADHGVHCVAVAGVDRSGGRDPHLTWGLIADIDLVRAVQGGSSALAAGSIVATAPIALQEDDFLDRAAALMIKHHTSHLVAVNRTGLPSGIVSTFDVARVMALPDPTHRLPGGT